jgi:hypothetical protein
MEANYSTDQQLGQLYELMQAAKNFDDEEAAKRAVEADKKAKESQNDK